MGIFNKKKEVKPEMKNSQEFEVASAPEKQSQGLPEFENIPEREIPAQGKQAETDQPGLNQALPSVKPSESQAVPAVSKSSRQEQIERILEADLGEVYFQMDAQHQAIFKAAGEETAQKIENLLTQVKVKTQQIFELIKSWLQLIPNINKWFIMQESKIKTDKIIKIKSEN